jgi:ABC-type branched-subunit amino acid transport system permease subunit
MVIIGGMGSIMGSFFGAAFIVMLPIFLNQFLPWAWVCWAFPFPPRRFRMPSS